MAAEKNDFLAVYHSLKFSKLDKDDLEVADIERRCVATKYFTAKKLESEELAGCLLRKGLFEYHNLIASKDGVNNYWNQIKAQTEKNNNDPRKWTSSLNDVEIALDFVKPMPCQEDKTLPCQAKVISDRCIEKIVDTWKNKDKFARNRKISSQDNEKYNRALASQNITPMEYENIRNKREAPVFSSVSSNTNDENGYNLENEFNKQFSKSFPPNAEVTNFPRQTSLRLDPESQLSKRKLVAAPKPKYAQQHSYRNKSTSKPIAPTQNEEEQENDYSSFKTARQELSIQQAKANKSSQKKTLGGKPSINSKFVCPFKKEKEKSEQPQDNVYDGENNSSETENEMLKNIEPKMVELIKNEIMDSKTTISWDDIAGLQYAKKIIMEVVVYPMLRPDIFTGLRRPPKGILLFGPPGTGKTLIGKCIASQSKSTFFSISASSLTSKWIGEGEKMVRALFAVARVYQPSVIFVDEIDSLLTQRSETEHESSRRLKTEFLVQLDGAATAEDDRILIVGATNRPQELDEAARRRLVKRLYVPLPEFQARKQIINKLLITVPHDLTETDVNEIAEQSKGYSGADMTNLCKEASMGPIRSIPFSQLEDIKKEDVRQVTINDFKEALIHVRPSVSESSLSTYVEWDSIYGTGTAQNYKV